MKKRIICLMFSFLFNFLTIPQYCFAEWETEWGAEIKADVRYDVDRVDETGFSRNENSLRLFLTTSPNEHILLRGDARFVWIGFSRDLTIEGLTLRSNVDPWRIESDAAYIDIMDIFDGLDIRIGRQIVQWGTADMFNPTDNINPDDLEDPLLFGRNIANEMIKIDYTFSEALNFSLVWVPVFRSAILPSSATFAVADPTGLPPVLEQDIKDEITNLQHSMCTREEIDNGRTDCILPDPITVRIPNVEAETPGFSINNTQIAARVKFRIRDVDFSLSYYRGFDDVPVPVLSDARFDPGYDGDAGTVICDPDNPGDESLCGHYVDTKVVLKYPRINVFGFDIAGQLPFLDNAGFWFEGAVIWPEEMKMLLTFPKSHGLPLHYDMEGTVVTDRPFLKFTAGLDYTINQYIFITGQFVRGFTDELGEENLNNYFVGGVDFKFWQERILLRLFTMIEIDTENPSFVAFPMFQINPWGSFTLDLGAFLLFGNEDSKFGQKATGASTVFMRATASF